MFKRLFSVCAVLATLSATAQCDAGQTEVTFQIFTDAWGYEMYWEVVPTGQAQGKALELVFVSRGDIIVSTQLVNTKFSVFTYEKSLGNNCITNKHSFRHCLLMTNP